MNSRCGLRPAEELELEGFGFPSEQGSTHYRAIAAASVKTKFSWKIDSATANSIDWLRVPRHLGM